MKKIFAIMALITCLTLSACTGVAVRDNILMPLASEIYGHIYPQIELGLADAVEDGDLPAEGAEAVLQQADLLKAVLQAGDRVATLEVDWSQLEPWAARGVQDMIDDGTISPGVATSLFQRIVNFRDLLSELGVMLSRSSTRGIYSTEKVIAGRPVFLGYAPKVDPDWTPLERHNRPRRALGLPEISVEDLRIY